MFTVSRAVLACRFDGRCERPRAAMSPRTFRRLCAARDRLSAPDERRISIADAARVAGLSRYHFIRRFRALFGETPHQCRTRARLDRAKALLATSDCSVTRVCLDVGFTSVGSFSDLFRRRVGVSPSAYRHRVRSLQSAPRTMPRELIPGCLTLMGQACLAVAQRAEAGNFREVGACRSGRLSA